MKLSRRDLLFVSTLLLVLLAVAAAIRFYNLGGQSLWSDEGNSAALATRSFAQISRDASRDIHPPLYYWLLHLWTGVFGTGEVGLRSLSALLGVWLVLAVARLGQHLYGATTGLAAALIAALAPFQIYYSQEARMYILLALLATYAITHFASLLAREDRALRQAGALPLPWFSGPDLGLVLTWVAGLYTHYAFPLIIALSTGLYALWLILTARQGQVVVRILRWIVLLALTVAFFAPWLPVALHQIRSWPAGGSTMAPGEGLLTSLSLLALGPEGHAQAGSGPVWVLLILALAGALPWRALSTTLARRMGTTADGSPVRPDLAAGPQVAAAMAAGLPAGLPEPALAGAGVAAFPGTAAAMTATVPRINQPAASPVNADPTPALSWLRWLTVVSWVLAPIVMMLVLGLFRDAYLKFLLIASPAYCLLLARGATGIVDALTIWGRSRQRGQLPPPGLPWYTLLGFAWAAVALTIIGIVSGTAINRSFTDPSLARDDYRGIAQFIAATAQPNDAILLDAPGQAEVFDYYYHGDLPIMPLPQQRPLDRQTTLANLAALTRYDKVYALYWASQEADPDGVVSDWMDHRSYKTLDQWRGNVRLVVYTMPERGTPDETADGLNLELGSGLRLLGYRAWNLTPHAGEVTQLQLMWRADRVPSRRYKVFLQLLDPRDQVIAQRDAEPAGESRPTTTWTPGEVILDNHGLLIPPGTPPGTYRRIAGLYDAETLQRLHLPTGEDHIDLPSITVARSPVPPPLAALDMQSTQNFDFGGIKLLGYDRYKRDFKHAPETPLHPGDRLHLTFYWQANVQPRADWWFDMTLSDNAGRVVSELQAPLVGPVYSTTLWQVKEIVRGEHDLPLPASLAPDTYRLSLTLLPDINTPAGVAYLGTVTVTKPEK
ncbi:MAG TPA: glycosyltransferase family 39 protein [Anaerolineae bacterium]